MENFSDKPGKKGIADTFKRLGFGMSRSADSSDNAHWAHLEKTARELQDQVRYYENEVRELMESLERQMHEFEALKRKYYKNAEQLQEARRQNEKLVGALNKAKMEVEELREEVSKLCSPPNAYAVFRKRNKDGTVDIQAEGRKLKVNVHPAIDLEGLVEGQEVILNEALNVIDHADFRQHGEVVQIKEFLDASRVVVLCRADEEKVIRLAGNVADLELKIGDHLLMDPHSNYAYERLPKNEVGEVVLEEVPEVTYDDIGGLDEQIQMLKDSIELPYLYPSEFKEHRLSPPKGILLYGPPGCGKTLLAKAVANSLARKMEQMTGKKTEGYFLSVKGPELLNKYVGETEHKIREVFSKAREKASDKTPVIVFFDEIDSLFRVRGSGISSDMEFTVVAQFLAEIDGLESLKNVIVIGASNRQDLIDPAVLRPGRLDLKIKIDRPDAKGAREIFSKYLKPDLPFHPLLLGHHRDDPEDVVQALIEDAVSYMFSTVPENKFLEVTYARGDKEIFYFKDFSSGSMIENIVRRSKMNAVKRLITTGERGITQQDLIDGIIAEFKENEDLPNTTNPDDWAKISGRKGEKIVNIRTFVGGNEEKARTIETISAGQYL